MESAPVATAFNHAEAVVWFLFAIVCGVQMLRADARVRGTLLGLAVSFAAFGVSDLIEARSGAWWRPWWLLVLKGACLVSIVAAFARYRRLR